MRSIAYFGTYPSGEAYSRSANTISALSRAGFSVTECHFQLWKDRRDRSNLGPLGFLLRLARIAVSQLVLSLRFFRWCGKVDAIFVGTAGHIDVPTAFLLSRLTGKKLFFDAFYSLYDTIVNDRGYLRAGSLSARLLHSLEGLLMKLPDVVFMDTVQHAEYLSSEFSLARPVLHFPPGVPAAFLERISRGGSGNTEDGGFKCLFYGSYVPLQGARTIVRAAAELRNEADITFVMIGDGQERELCGRIAGENSLENLVFKPWMSVDELAEQVLEADACLGIFGRSEKADRVVPYKVFSYMAASKPTVTRSSPAAADILQDGVSVLFVPPEDPSELAQRILWLRDNREKADQIGVRAAEVFASKASVEAIAAMLKSALAKGEG